MFSFLNPNVGLQAFMEQHGFNSIEDFRGESLSYFTSHTELVRLGLRALLYMAFVPLHHC